LSGLLNSGLLRHCLALFIAGLLLTACAGTQPLTLEDPEINQVWPQAPETPRIKLLRSLKGAEDLVDKKAKKNRIFGWLTGEMAGQVPLVTPYGIATDGQGMIWITDPGLQAVHLLDLEKRKSRLLAMAGTERFSSPTGICYDAARQRIYVADSLTKRVVALSVGGEFLTEILPDTPFGRPGGMAVDPQGNLLVADVLGGKIRRFSPAGKELEALGNPTTPDGLFNRPIGVAVDANGLIYVIDSLNFKIEVMTSTGEAVASIGKLGDTPGSLARPRGIAVDSHGHIYVADAAFDNIQIFNQEGQLLLVFGGGGKHGLSLPASLFVDKRDRIYAVDSSNHQVQIYQFLGIED
jgi:sugar lactone lactonase YvrE